jgi:hypothetical protein
VARGSQEIGYMSAVRDLCLPRALSRYRCALFTTTSVTEHEQPDGLVLKTQAEVGELVVAGIVWLFNEVETLSEYASKPTSVKGGQQYLLSLN